MGRGRKRIPNQDSLIMSTDDEDYEHVIGRYIKYIGSDTYILRGQTRLGDVSASDLIERPELKDQYDACVKIKALYHYWKVERHQLQRQYDQALDEWCELRLSKNNTQTDTVWKELNDLEAKVNDREDEMVMNLVKVRRHLWS